MNTSKMGLCAWGLLLCSLLPWTVSAQLADDGETPWFQQSVDNRKYAVILTGAAASQEIRERFRDWSVALYNTLVSDYDYSDDELILLLDDGSEISGAPVAASSRVEDVRDALVGLQSIADQGDQVTLIMIGHGSGTFGEAKFNNIGPDMTGNDLAAMLEGFSGQDLVVINTTSASFEFSRALAARGRVIVSATRSPAERYDPVFGRYLVEGLQNKTADLDRNGRVSVLEVFNYASGRVAQWYDEQGRLATEHPVLDDTGDGLFSREPGRDQSDGLLAEIAYFDVITPGEEKTSARALQLRAEMQALERDIFILRNQKQNYLEDDYWSRLEALLIDLATRTRTYDALP